MSADLADGVIFLRPLRLEDASDHLAGEDEEMAKWLSGGRSTLATVQHYISSCEEHWRTNGPRHAFGVFDCATQRLIGSIEANLAYRFAPGEVNVSYGVFPGWRGKGVAQRALNLMGLHLRCSTELREMVVRIVCENTASLRVVEKAGFRFLGIFDEPEGRMARYARDL
jgi:RimJ/RimL family protein N-acetyltransferase